MSLKLDLKRIFREGLVSFWRNKIVSFASILIMVMSLLVLSSIIFMNGVMDFSLKQLEDRVDVNIYFYPNTPESDILELQNKIALIPEVADISYTSDEEALYDFIDRHQDDELVKRSLQEVSQNPLGASLNIKAYKSAQYEAIILGIEDEINTSYSDLVERVNYHDNQKVIERLNQFAGIMRTIAYATTLFFMIIAILVIMSTMRIAIYATKQEIIVKRLVGAEHRYINGPFMVMGALYGLIAGIITMIVLFPISQWVGDYTKTFFGGMNIAHFYKINILQITVILIAFGIIVGVISSIIAVRKYLRI